MWCLRRLWSGIAPAAGWVYGGGYFDRTLAHLSPRPFAIGIGLQAAELATIYPQPHDMRLDAIVTEEGVQFIRSPGGAPSSSQDQVAMPPAILPSSG